MGWTVTIASAIWCMLDSSYDSLSSPLNIIQSHPFAIIYLGGVTTALANYIQTKAQQNISGETMGVQGYFGAFLISCAAIANAVLDFGSRRVDGIRTFCLANSRMKYFTLNIYIPWRGEMVCDIICKLIFI